MILPSVRSRFSNVAIVLFLSLCRAFRALFLNLTERFAYFLCIILCTIAGQFHVPIHFLSNGINQFISQFHHAAPFACLIFIFTASRSRLISSGDNPSSSTGRPSTCALNRFHLAG